jgi:prophage antirepressor-like protein
VKDMILNQFEGKQIRMQLDESGNPWWVAKDVCEALGFKKPDSAYKKVDADDKDEAHIKGIPPIQGEVVRQSMVIVNESGLYALIFQSHSDAAKKFKKWITSEVLPSIRKTGAYFRKELTLDERLALALEVGVDARKQLADVRVAIQEVKSLAIQASSHNSANTGFMTIRGYCNVNGVKLSLKETQKFGRECSRLMRVSEQEVHRTDDEMFGKVNSYPVEILEQAFGNLY